MALTDRKAWNELRKHAVDTGNLPLAQLLDDDDDRFAGFSLREGNLLFDYSRQRVDETTIELLCQLARDCELEAWVGRLFGGERINASEDRVALNTALRAPVDSKLMVDGDDVVAGIQDTLGRMQQIVERVHSGQWRGFSGLPVDTKVNIGVGGSDIGPFMASKALISSRADGSQIAEHQPPALLPRAA